MSLAFFISVCCLYFAFTERVLEKDSDSFKVSSQQERSLGLIRENKKLSLLLFLFFILYFLVGFLTEFLILVVLGLINSISRQSNMAQSFYPLLSGKLLF